MSNNPRSGDRPFVYEDFFGGKEPEGGFQHVCGLRGYSPMIDEPCPACVAARREREVVR